MSGNDCSTMEMYCLERARLEPLSRGKWIAQRSAGTSLHALRIHGDSKRSHLSSQCTQSLWQRNVSKARASAYIPLWIQWTTIIAPKLR
jgi:hypothetical protein